MIEKILSTIYQHRMVIFALVGVLLGWILGRWRLNRAYQKLLERVRSVRHGQSSGVVEASGGGVLGEMAREFNQILLAWGNLREELKRAPAMVERKVVRRTEGLQRAVRRLQKEAHTDGLTGLANRAYFDEYLEVLFRQVCDDHADLACLMIDVDKFKLVNDNLGHAAGDDLIVFIGELLKACTRDGDVSGRYGGDEFVVLLQAVSEREAMVIAERIRMLFGREARRFGVVLNGGSAAEQVVTPHLSVGLATRKKNQARDAWQLIKMADEALYRAKEGGRDRVVVY